MKKWFTKRSPSSVCWSAAALAIAMIGGLTACYPGEISSISETQVVLTAYDKDFDFSEQRTYAIPDTVVEVCDIPNPPEGLPISCEAEDRIDYDHANDVTFVDRTVQNMDALGYTRIPADQVDENNLPDVVVVLMVAVNEWTAYTYYPCGGYWGWWGWYPPGYGCWYPGYVASTSWEQGTLIVDMLYPAGIDGSDERVPSIWTGSINGVLSSNQQTNIDLALSGMDQAFDQSADYLLVR